MKKMKGISVSNGVAIGRAQIVSKPKLEISKKTIEHHEIKPEIERFEENLQQVLGDIDHLIENIAHSKDDKDILFTHKMILQDPEFIKKIKKLINNELLSLEMAIKIHFTDIVEIFNNMENDYFAQRSSDYEDVAYRLLSQVLQQKTDFLEKVEENTILIMENISPSLVTKVFAKNIGGLCTEKGSKNSHSSIIARSMNLPMIVNISDLLKNVKNNDLLIVDGNTGDLVVSAEKEILQKYNRIQKAEVSEKEYLQKLIDIPSETQDGRKIKLMSNIEIPQEMEQVLNVKSEGIGLFRTEFMFIGQTKLPSENAQYKVYREIAKSCYPEPLTIRTIDVGGDKLSQLLNIEHEINPNLGCRGIRISLRHDEVFKTQIKAIYRANIKGNIKVMFPMISSVGEIHKVRQIMKECEAELKRDGQDFYPNLKIGAMIEIPSAAVTSDMIAKECDFLSIGTNDLVQYTLAVDRDNPSVEEYYQPSSQAVLRLIKMTVENAHKAQIKVAICGEMASEKKYIKLLIGLGIDEFSVSPGRLLMVKNEIIKANFKDAKSFDERIFCALEEVE